MSDHQPLQLEHASPTDLITPVIRIPTTTISTCAATKTYAASAADARGSVVAL